MRIIKELYTKTRFALLHILILRPYLYSGLHSKDVKGWTLSQPFSCAMYISHFRVLTRPKAVAFAKPHVPIIHV